MGNYTIKGLAKVNECETFDAEGLARVWEYWLGCNCNDRQSVADFMRLRKADRKEMLAYLEGYNPDLYRHILNHIDF